MWSLHEALTAVRLQDSSSAELRDLLLAAVVSPVFLRCSEGLRFLVFLFSLSPAFVEDIHEAVRRKLPGIAKQDEKAYAEMYHKVCARCVHTELRT